MLRRLGMASFVVICACYPTTTRPPFIPLPTAPQAEVQLFVPQATRETALALDTDSIPVRRTEPKDGWLESDWLDAGTLHATTSRRLGDQIVKVRAWVDPSKPNYSIITIETVYRPLDDPSRDERSLERQVSDSNPVAKRVAAVLKQLRKQFGDTLPISTPTQIVKKPAGGR